MKVLVIDVGGTNIKLKVSDQEEVRKLPSGPTLTAKQLVADVVKATADWQYDAISIGYPGPVIRGKIAMEPVNLGPGWLGFDFAVFGKPVKIINDAAMQALGSYEGGRMLFLGLGTGLGSTLILDGVIGPMELGHLPYKKGKTFEEYVGVAGLKRLGKNKWQATVFDVVERLRKALLAEYVVLGGGNVKKLTELPPGSRQGDNNNAFIGGVRLWEQKQPPGVLAMADPQPEPVLALPRRGQPLLAWLVIAGVVAFTVWRTERPNPARDERLDLVLMEVQARYFVGAAGLAPGTAKSLYATAKGSLNRGAYGQRLRFVVLADDLAGPAEAHKCLQELERLSAEQILVPSAEERRLTELLARLYRGRLFENRRPPPPVLSEAEKAELRRGLGWLGELAVAPEEPGGREAVWAPARRTAVFVMVLFGLLLCLAGAGFIVLIVLVVFLFQGRLRSRLGYPSGTGGIYAETFALWMLLFVGLNYALSFLPRGWSSLLLSGGVMLASLGVLAWPVLRGVSWQQVRQEVGLHANGRPLPEILLGVGCYVTALPLLLVGLLLMGGLLLLKRRVGLPDDPYGPSPTPSHPIVEAVVRGGWVVRVQVLLAACVVAPVVEEIVFRGLLYRHVREASAGWGRFWSVGASALLVSLVFALIHPQGLLTVPGLMALALAFALAREWRGALLPSMVAHGLNNGVLLLALILMAG